MRGKSLPDEHVGKATLRIIMDGPVYRGTVIRDGKLGQQFEETDLDRLRHRLREETARTDPNFWGFDSAMARFLSFNAKGFADPKYIKDERTYKDDACHLLRSLLPLDQALSASPQEAASLVKVVSKTNLLAHQHEQQQMRTILCGPVGHKLVRASAQIALGDFKTGLSAIAALEHTEGRISWPIATYLPFLWEPRSNMLLKPEVTQDFAKRVGHDFPNRYDAALEAPVYAALLDLARVTEERIASLAPKDWIDVQSFIWVVGKYIDDDRYRIPNEGSTSEDVTAGSQTVEP